MGAPEFKKYGAYGQLPHAIFEGPLRFAYGQGLCQGRVVQVTGHTKSTVVGARGVFPAFPQQIKIGINRGSQIILPGPFNPRNS